MGRGNQRVFFAGPNGPGPPRLAPGAAESAAAHESAGASPATLRRATEGRRQRRVRRESGTVRRRRCPVRRLGLEPLAGAGTGATRRRSRRNKLSSGLGKTSFCPTFTAASAISTARWPNAWKRSAWPRHRSKRSSRPVAQRRQQETSLRAFPGVRATLDRVRTAGLRCAILTNSDRCGRALREDLGKIGLDRAFDGVTTSLDLGLCLPDAACYERAIEGLHVAAQRVLFVSHDPRALAGAVTAGLAAVAFNVRQQVRVKQIDRFEQLCDAISTAAADQSCERVASRAADHCPV